MKKVFICGCGWVGKALRDELEDIYELTCLVKTQKSLDTLETTDKFLFSQEILESQQFYNADSIVIAIPPRGLYLESLRMIPLSLSSKTQVILLSSTSVYPQVRGVVEEEDTKKIINPTLMLEGERLVQKRYANVLILRLGGLMGYNRVAGKYTSGKIKDYDAPVNYIHRDDVINIIKLCIEKEVKSQVFNVVAPNHPRQSEIYTKNSEAFNWESTKFNSLELKGKMVSSSKLIKFLSYTFLKENPLYFWKDTNSVS